MRCGMCGNRSFRDPCGQCRIVSVESEAQEWDYQDWGTKAKKIKDSRKKAFRGAKAMKGRRRKKR